MSWSLCHCRNISRGALAIRTVFAIHARRVPTGYKGFLFTLTNGGPPPYWRADLIHETDRPVCSATCSWVSSSGGKLDMRCPPHFKSEGTIHGGGDANRDRTKINFC